MSEDTEQEEEYQPRFCGWCQEELHPETASTKWCSRRCENAFYYSRNKDRHRKLYLEAKKRWERSPVGKRAGVSLYKWWRTAQDFRE